MQTSFLNENEIIFVHRNQENFKIAKHNIALEN